jgi:hypothetical protein
MNETFSDDWVIAAYRAKPGCEKALDALMREHVPTLKRLGLVAETPTTTLRAAEGEIVEIFAWKPGAVEKAHRHPEVAALWRKFETVCDFIPVSEVSGCDQIFAPFAPFR